MQMILDRSRDRRALLSQKDVYWNSAVHLAVIQNTAEILGMLLQQGAPNDRANTARCSYDA